MSGEHDNGRPRGGHRLRLMLAAALLAGVAGLVGTDVSPAGADGPTTFTNTTSIAIPAAGSANQIGLASPFPSPISVSGMAGPVTDVTVTLNNLTHSALNDVDVLLVAPTGENLVVLSDTGDVTPPTGTTANNATYTFSDAAAGSFLQSGAIPSGTYRPTNNGTGDPFPAPAPSISPQTTLAGAFTGIDANGTWQLYVVDDATGDVGTMAGGWSLTITTEAAGAVTTTTVTTSATPSLIGDPVTFTATVTSAGNPVPGVVQFSDGGTSLGPPILLNASGVATLTTSALGEGTHTIFANYTGLNFLRSNGTVTQRVDNPTIVTGNTFCNAGPLTIPTFNQAQPYPSNITVSGLSGTILDVTVTLRGLTHSFSADIDMLLAAPGGTNNLVLLSDIGGTTGVSNADVVFDDAAAGPLPTPIVGGTFRPTDDDTGGVDTFPAPAPVPTGATTLATFDGTAPNGTWSLYVNDDASGDGGSIAGGWCLTVVTPAPTATALTSSANPSTIGQSVTFTATVTAAGVPVTEGTVSFTDDGSPLGGPVTVAADGTATFTTSALTVATHPILATYSGATTLLPSAATVGQSVNPIADAGGPYTVAEGAALTLDGAGSTPGGTYAWDLDGDGDFADATGAAPTLSWAELEALAITDGPGTHEVAVRVTVSGQMATATTQLAVTNTAPRALITGALTATVGVPFTLEVGADDPSSSDMAGLFRYTADWGDGSPIESLDGPADPPVTHTYGAAGTFSATFTATDKDGGSGAGSIVQVQVSPAATPSTTTPATTTPATTTPATTTPVTTAPPTTTAVGTPTPPTTPTAPVVPGGILPSTGAGTTPLLRVALVITATALGLLFCARRRRRVTP